MQKHTCASKHRRSSTDATVGVAAAISHTVRPASSVPTGEALKATSERIPRIHNEVLAQTSRTDAMNEEWEVETVVSE